MIYPKDFENKTGFAPLRELLIDLCETRLGKEQALKMSFLIDRSLIEKKLRAVDEMLALFSSGSSMRQDNVHDIVPWLKELKIAGSWLSADKLYKIAQTLRSISDTRQFFAEVDEEGKSRYPVLSQEFSELEDFSLIIKEIERCIDKFGEVKDNASPALADIRREMAGAGAALQRNLRRVMERAVKEGLVESDASPSIREGRMVIPVTAAHRKEIPGIVHDRSATGKTLFIEPSEVVEAGNRLKELELEENREIIIILSAICESLRPEIEEIVRCCFLMAKLDFIKAKAKFAQKTDGEMPVIEKNPEIDWFHAVHPELLLKLRKQGREPVALNLNLDKNHRFLIISGPNAGGKSVTLKTVAVVQYMMQCGLLPSLHYNSHMGIFDNIFIDIGDEQSIENDLSTYSSHLNNMKFFLSHSDKKSLILADEMGSGTEPQIGGALAEAILDVLGDCGCMGIVTTHYQNLKTFAENKEGFINGAMMYDRQKLQPTFQLSVGNAGSSFALEIARKTGLPSSVIEKAKSIVGSEYADIDKYLLDIQRDKRYWQNKRLSIKEKEHKLDKLLENYEETAADLKSQRNAILRAAKEEARGIISEANAKIERSIHEIRKADAEKERTRQIRKEIEDYRQSLEKDKEQGEEISPIRELRHKSNKSKQKPLSPAKKDEVPGLKVDDYVRMSEGGVTGKILAVDGKRAEVAFGALRTFVDLSKLKKVNPGKGKDNKPSFTVSSSQSDESRNRQLNFRQDIDLRGMRADEALQALTYFLDDAVQFNAHKLRILHGTGHGILRTLIRQQLKSHPSVADFHDEDVRFGGAGITVVTLEN